MLAEAPSIFRPTIRRLPNDGARLITRRPPSCIPVAKTESEAAGFSFAASDAIVNAVITVMSALTAFSLNIRAFIGYMHFDMRIDYLLIGKNAPREARSFPILGAAYHRLRHRASGR